MSVENFFIAKVDYYVIHAFNAPEARTRYLSVLTAVLYTIVFGVLPLCAGTAEAAAPLCYEPHFSGSAPIFTLPRDYAFSYPYVASLCYTFVRKSPGRFSEELWSVDGRTSNNIGSIATSALRQFSCAAKAKPFFTFHTTAKVCNALPKNPHSAALADANTTKLSAAAPVNAVFNGNRSVLQLTFHKDGAPFFALKNEHSSARLFRFTGTKRRASSLVETLVSTFRFSLWCIQWLKRVALWLWTGNVQFLELKQSIARETYSANLVPRLSRIVVGSPFPEHMKHHYDFAAYDSGARVVDSSPSIKNVRATQRQDFDSYMLAPCNKPIWFVMSFNTQIYLKAIGLVSQEFFSSTFRTIQVLGSDAYPTRRWRLLAVLHAQFNRPKELFDVESSCRKLEPPDCWLRFIKIRVVDTYQIDHYSYCTLNRFQVFGSDVLESLDTKMRGEQGHADPQDSGSDLDTVYEDHEIDFEPNEAQEEFTCTDSERRRPNKVGHSSAGRPPEHPNDKTNSSLFDAAGGRAEVPNVVTSDESQRALNSHTSKSAAIDELVLLKKAHERLLTAAVFGKDGHLTAQPAVTVNNIPDKQPFVEPEEQRQTTAVLALSLLTPNATPVAASPPTTGNTSTQHNASLTLPDSSIAAGGFVVPTTLPGRNSVAEENCTTSNVSLDAIEGGSFDTTNATQHKDSDTLSLPLLNLTFPSESHTVTPAQDTQLFQSFTVGPAAPAQLFNVSSDNVHLLGAPPLVQDLHVSSGTTSRLPTPSGPSLLGLVDRVSVLERLIMRIENTTSDLLVGYRYFDAQFNRLHKDLIEAKNTFDATSLKQQMELWTSNFTRELKRFSELPQRIAFLNGLVYRTLCGVYSHDSTSGMRNADVGFYDNNILWPFLYPNVQLCAQLKKDVTVTRWPELQHDALLSNNLTSVSKFCGSSQVAAARLTDAWMTFTSHSFLGILLHWVVALLKTWAKGFGVCLDGVRYVWNGTAALMASTCGVLTRFSETLEVSLVGVPLKSSAHSFSEKLESERSRQSLGRNSWLCADPEPRSPWHCVSTATHTAYSQIDLGQESAASVATRGLVILCQYTLRIPVIIINALIAVHNCVAYLGFLGTLIFRSLRFNKDFFLYLTPCSLLTGFYYSLRLLLLIFSEVTVDRLCIVFLFYIASRFAQVLRPLIADIPLVDSAVSSPSGSLHRVCSTRRGKGITSWHSPQRPNAVPASSFKNTVSNFSDVLATTSRAGYGQKVASFRFFAIVRSAWENYHWWFKTAPSQTMLSDRINESQWPLTTVAQIVDKELDVAKEPQRLFTQCQHPISQLEDVEIVSDHTVSTSRASDNNFYDAKHPLAAQYCHDAALDGSHILGQPHPSLRPKLRRRLQRNVLSLRSNTATRQNQDYPGLVSSSHSHASLMHHLSMNSQLPYWQVPVAAITSRSPRALTLRAFPFGVSRLLTTSACRRRKLMRFQRHIKHSSGQRSNNTCYINTPPYNELQSLPLKRKALLRRRCTTILKPRS